MEAMAVEIEEQQAIPVMGIQAGADYVYLPSWPEGRKGHLYRVKRMVLDVPTYQQKVLIRAMSGPDEGLWFTCSPWNFSTRYRRASQ